jgi:ABC-type phosphate transport system substrate-binding protein
MSIAIATADRQLTKYALEALKEGGYDLKNVRVVEKVAVVTGIGNTSCAELEGVLYVILETKADVYVLDDDAYYMTYSGPIGNIAGNLL